MKKKAKKKLILSLPVGFAEVFDTLADKSGIKCDVLSSGCGTVEYEFKTNRDAIRAASAMKEEVRLIVAESLLEVSEDF